MVFRPSPHPSAQSPGLACKRLGTPVLAYLTYRQRLCLAFRANRRKGGVSLVRRQFPTRSTSTGHETRRCAIEPPRAQASLSSHRARRVGIPLRPRRHARARSPRVCEPPRRFQHHLCRGSVFSPSLSRSHHQLHQL